MKKNTRQDPVPPLEENEIKKLKEAAANSWIPLTLGEYSAFSLRFGLEDGEPKSREEVASQMQCDDVMVERLEKEAVRKAISQPIRSLLHQALVRWHRHDSFDDGGEGYDYLLAERLTDQAIELSGLLELVGVAGAPGGSSD